MFKLGDIAVSRKLMLLLSLALVGFIALLLISASALHRNLMSEREARLQAVLDLAMSRIHHAQQHALRWRQLSVRTR